MEEELRRGDEQHFIPPLRSIYLPLGLYPLLTAGGTLQHACTTISSQSPYHKSKSNLIPSSTPLIHTYLTMTLRCLHTHIRYTPSTEACPIKFNCNLWMIMSLGNKSCRCQRGAECRSQMSIYHSGIWAIDISFPDPFRSASPLSNQALHASFGGVMVGLEGRSRYVITSERLVV